MNTKIKRSLITILCALSVICFMLSIIGFKSVTAGEGQAKIYMNLTSEELPFDSSTNFRASSGNGQIYANGTLLESFAAPVMTVWHFPKPAEVQLDTIVRKHHLTDAGTLNFRIVHEHADTGKNEVIFPSSGEWFNLNSVALNDAGTAYSDTHIDGYVNMQAGDKLKMIVYNADNGGWCTVYLTGGIKFIFDGGTASGLRLYNNSPT